MVKVDKGQWDKSQGAKSNHEFNMELSGFSVGYAMQQLGMKILTNLSCRYFTHATETLIWSAKNVKSKHCF